MTEYPTVNRADLAWLLGAVLPHAGKTKGPYVGLRARGGVLYGWAIDGYTAGLAKVDITGEIPDAVYLSPSETKELIRYVRPNNKAHEAESVVLTDEVLELHVGLVDDSAVFELAEPWEGLPAASLETVAELFEDISAQLNAEPPFQYDADFAVRFAKAKRRPTDFMALRPVEKLQTYVTVGDSFWGAIMGVRKEAA